ncbi:Ig-like domain-containing protein [Dyadobacter sp. CY312]|uniref:Ig-like domain-containing protein n=1 Tax=Dyadobacter sp. CY312 TaxID=2907303 RepID=UPI001F16770A|nr:Ig-like domain-containing protein [Dyadobacter sp. CY312]MCE7044534.1 Ig-like domain-containing protein [Dyadobacter sp. CY312]
MKQNSTGKLWHFLLAGLLFAGAPGVRAQCPAGCNSNYGLNSDNNAATIEYDNIIAGDNKNIAKESDGTFKAWGFSIAPNGSSNQLSPLVINSTNFPGLQGTVLKAAIGKSQAVVLTTEGLYAWSATNSMLSTTVKSTAAMGPVTIVGSNAYRLPQGVEPANVKSLFGTGKTLALLTCSGELWVLTQNAPEAGAGLSAVNHIWNRVTTGEPGNPTLDNVVAIRGSNYNLIALRADGTLWTWGAYSYLGDGTAFTSRNRATQMTLPNPGGTIKMIGMTGNTYASYYVLYTDGNLYAMGYNDVRQMGDWTVTARTTWVQPRYNSASGPVMNNIHWISPNEHSDGLRGINVLTTAGQVYNWGVNYQNKLRSTNSTIYGNVGIDPGSPNTDRMLAIESGDTHTIVIKACTQNFGFAGNQYYGNMGDGSGTYNVPKVPYTYSTAPVNICGANAMTTTGAPVFNAGLPTSRCQSTGTATETYTATASGGTVSYSLSPAAAGSINTSTAAVTYNAGWAGTAVITATAAGGCGTPETATHTVIVSPTVGTPVFAAGATAERCGGAVTTTYAATAAAADSYTYSINNVGTGTQPTVDAATGAVSFAANWVGQSTITVQATGCGSTTTSSMVVTTKSVIANDDSYPVVIGLPYAFNVLTNDACNYDASTVTITQQPSQGLLQQGANGAFTFTALGTYTGPLSFQYQVCNPGSTVCETATVTFDVTSAGNADPCGTANADKLFYLPFPENTTQLLASLRSAGNSTTNNVANMRTAVSLSIPYPSTIVVYDHWEDGYEADINTPTQGTTQIWGDGILSNGVAPGTTNDLIPPGFTITMDNTFAYTRPTSTVVYDGKDKIYTSNEVAITKFSGSTSTYALQSVKTNVVDVSKFGNLYVLPFGEDVPTKFSMSTVVFKYTGLFIRAIENGTVVTISIPASGALPAHVATSPTLNEGEVWYYAGTASPTGSDPTDVNKAIDLKAGTVVSSTKKFGVDAVFGGIDGFGTRNIPLYPAEFFGSEYFTPVYSTSANNDVYAYFVNPNANPITINWNRGNGSTGSFIVAGGGAISRHQLNAATGTRYTSAGGEPFQGVVIVDDNASSSSMYDWAYTLLPINRLTSFAKLGFAPGNDGSTDNTNPVWVTTKEATIVYVKNDGNITTGTTASPCGAYFDTSYTLGALQAQKIRIGDDNSGAAFFNCDGVPMSVAWGEEPETTTPQSAPGLDVGYTVDGLCFKQLVFAVDDYDTTGIGTPVTVNVAQNDAGFLTGVDPASVSTDFLLQPANGTIVVNPNGTITYTPNFGFTGDDTFEYRICANAPQGGACDVATVYIHVGCGFAADANIISGMIYNDLNSSLAADNGDSPKAGTVVNIYKDAGVIGTFEPGIDILESSATSDADGKYSTSVTTLKNVKDEFTTNAVNNSNGSENWAGNWTVVTGSASLTNSASLVNLATGALQVGIDNSGTQNGAYRVVNLTGKTKAVLAYDWVKSAFTNDANDWVEVQVSANGSAPWTSLHRFTGLPALTGSHSFVIPAALMSATTTIRFVEPNNTSTGTLTRNVRFDNIEVKTFIAANYIVKPASATPVSNPTQHTVSFTGSAQSDCDNNFGYAAVNIAGHVFNDADGDVVTDGGEKPVSGNNTNNGGTSVVTGGNLYANLVDGNGQVLQSVQVNADGSYAFAPVEGNLPYKVVLTTTTQAVNTVLTTGSGPSGWLATGTSLDGTPTVGNTSYVIDLGTVTANVDDADYGIQRPPVADPKTYEVNNSAFSSTPPAGGYPTVTGYQSIPASSSALTGNNYPTLGSLSGSDPEDCAMDGSCNTQGSTTFEIVAINSNTKVYYDFGAGPVEILPTPGNPISIPDFDVTKLVIYGENGGGTTAEPFGFTYAITDNAGVTSPAVPYTITTSSPLPVTLISFDAKREGSTVNLKWATTSEQNSKGFEIQRSADARNWKDLGFVAVKSENGNSTNTINYGFTDNAPLTGTSYYRLKMVDLDGSFGYSNIRSVDMEGGMAEVTLFPNPASSQLLLKDLNTSLAVSVTVINAAGVEVYTSTSNFQSVDVSRMPEGLYVLVVKQTGGSQTVRKFVVKK